MIYPADSFSGKITKPECQLTKGATLRTDMFKSSALIALFTALTACSASNSLETTAPTLPQRPIDNELMGPILTLNTVMTDEGVECPAVRGADGTLYTIPSMPRNFKRGDRLNIIITDPVVPVASFCQQGQTIDWLRIEWVSASGEILEAWDK